MGHLGPLAQFGPQFEKSGLERRVRNAVHWILSARFCDWRGAMEHWRFRTPRPIAIIAISYPSACEGLARPHAALAMALVQGRDVSRNVAVKSLPAPATNNEAAGVTVLRPNWSHGRERLVVAR